MPASNGYLAYQEPNAKTIFPPRTCNKRSAKSCFERSTHSLIGCTGRTEWRCRFWLGRASLSTQSWPVCNRFAKFCENCPFWFKRVRTFIESKPVIPAEEINSKGSHFFGLRQKGSHFQCEGCAKGSKKNAQENQQKINPRPNSHPNSYRAFQQKMFAQVDLLGQNQ